MAGEERVEAQEEVPRGEAGTEQHGVTQEPTADLRPRSPSSSSAPARAAASPTSTIPIAAFTQCAATTRRSAVARRRHDHDRAPSRTGRSATTSPASASVSESP
jgi:hypothetical protein